MKAPRILKLTIRIKNGKFASNLGVVSDLLKCYEGQLVDVTFKKRTNTRTKPQNRYYWAVIVPIFKNSIREEWGELWNSEDVHLFLKENCNFTERYNEDSGMVVRSVKSTTENSTQEQEDFHTRCRNLAAEFFNTHIPMPNEETNIEY